MAVAIFWNDARMAWQVRMRDATGAPCWLRDEHGEIAEVWPVRGGAINSDEARRLLHKFEVVDATFREMLP